MGAIATLLWLLIVACGIVSVVCWVMVLIKIFKENVGLGILGIICGLFAFIYGWVKVKEYDIKKVMLWWTVAFAATIVLEVIMMVVIGATVASGMH